MQEALELKKFFDTKKPMLLLLGEKNNSRANVLEKAATFTTPDQMVLRLKGKPTCQPKTLAELVHKHWAVNIDIDNDSRLNTQFNEIIECLTSQKQSCVLLIDHAHQLPISVLAALCHISHQQENKFIAIRIVLAGQASLGSKINALYLKKFAFPPVITIPEITPPKKRKPANQRRFFQNHKIKIIAGVGLVFSSVTLWQIEQHTPSLYNTHYTTQHKVHKTHA